MAIGDLLGWAAGIVGLDPAYLATIQGIENRQRADGSWPVSSAGAVGPMQVMPGTFEGVARQYGIAGTIYDDAANVLAGAYYLRDMLRRFGDPVLAAGAYHSGPGNAQRNTFGPYGRQYMSLVGTRYSGSGWGSDGSVAATPVQANAGQSIAPGQLDSEYDACIARAGESALMRGWCSVLRGQGRAIEERQTNPNSSGVNTAVRDAGNWFLSGLSRMGIGLVGFVIFGAGMAALVVASAKSRA